MAAPAGTNLASTQQSPSSVAGSKKRHECRPPQDGRTRTWTRTRTDDPPQYGLKSDCNTFYVHCDFYEGGVDEMFLNVNKRFIFVCFFAVVVLACFDGEQCYVPNKK